MYDVGIGPAAVFERPANGDFSLVFLSKVSAGTAY